MHASNFLRRAGRCVQSWESSNIFRASRKPATWPSVTGHSEPRIVTTATTDRGGKFPSHCATLASTSIAAASVDASPALKEGASGEVASSELSASSTFVALCPFFLVVLFRHRRQPMAVPAGSPVTSASSAGGKIVCPGIAPLPTTWRPSQKDRSLLFLRGKRFENVRKLLDPALDGTAKTTSLNAAANSPPGPSNRSKASATAAFGFPKAPQPKAPKTRASWPCAAAICSTVRHFWRSSRFWKGGSLLTSWAATVMTPNTAALAMASNPLSAPFFGELVLRTALT
mmetsp:Transcript_111862/g.311337  ORF Transcript_111862/g.311337 Transcript_111862/m.311337 type:complete len:286 (-) Transcript_111862:527-1384(-)